MKRFLITSPKFTGQAEVLYNANDVLCKIDCTQTNMSAVTIDHFKRAVPVIVQNLAASFSKDTTIIEAEYQISFDEFWKKYNKKINKIRCMLLWQKMEKTMQVKAYFGIDNYNKYLKHESWRNRVDPENYLRNQYWDNEYR
jgi:hypothetical protein